MGVRDEFAEHNFFRETLCVNRARKITHLVSSRLVEAFPQLFFYPPRVVAINNQGWMNLTLRIDTTDDDAAYILRLTERSESGRTTSKSLPHLEKERYVLELLKDLPFTPRLIEPATGILRISIPGEGEREYGYLLQSFIPFRPASAACVTQERGHVLEQLGAHLALIHQTQAEGFGTVFSERSGSFAFETFTEYLADKIRWVEDSPADSRMKQWLIMRLRVLMELDAKPRLYHRDLLGNWGNFLVDEDLKIRGIIDWEFAGVGLPLHSELASMIYVLNRDGAPQEKIQHDLSAVLRGYGVSLKVYQQDYERDTETLVLLDSIAALVKFETARAEGRLEKEPWRRVFADRARKLCYESFRLDSIDSRYKRLAA